MKNTLGIIPYSQANSYIKLWQDRKTVLVGGCFDLIHFGHLEFLKKSKQSGDFLIVALESDEFIKKNKRKDPIHNQMERAEILSNLKMVDAVILLPYFNSSDKYNELVKLVKPKVIAVTKGDLQLKNKKKQAILVGAEVKIVTPLLKKYSTRRIISDFS